MFPTLPTLIEYVFGIEIQIPVPTFGFFVALAFVCSYFTFQSEFKRKERAGIIKPVQKQFSQGNSATVANYLEYGWLGFLIGFKVFGAFFQWPIFLQSPLKFILSFQGSWLAGITGMLLFAYLIHWQKQKEKLPVPQQVNVVVHPYQLMPKLILWAAIWGFLGAKIFNLLENITLYQAYSFIDLLKYSGLTFLGGLVFGAISYLYIGHQFGMKLIDLADIGSPGMLVAYGVGRMGCHLSGDGDWGVVNTAPKPFSWLPDGLWASKFPHNVLNQGHYISGCSGNYCSALPQAVFPTSLYESLLVLSCFALLWWYRKKIKLSGLVFCIFLWVMGIERFFMEKIKTNHQYEVFGFNLSEAQMISCCFVALGMVLFFTILRWGRRSANASLPTF